MIIAGEDTFDLMNVFSAKVNNREIKEFYSVHCN